MPKSFTFYLLLFILLPATAQTRMRDVFAQLPDSVLPYMTKNNRLDCIDFIENGIEARVKNRFSEHVVLDSLTEDYLRLSTSTSSYVEMKLVPHNGDTCICVNRTYLGTTPDSDVRLYSKNWTLLSRLPRPAVSDFLYQPTNVIGSAASLVEEITTKPRNHETTEQLTDTLRLIRQEAEYLPLIKAQLSPTSQNITWTLQTAEFTKETKKVAEKYLRPVVKSIP